MSDNISQASSLMHRSHPQIRENAKNEANLTALSSSKILLGKEAPLYILIALTISQWLASEDQSEPLPTWPEGSAFYGASPRWIYITFLKQRLKKADSIGNYLMIFLLAHWDSNPSTGLFLALPRWTSTTFLFFSNQFDFWRLHEYLF